MIYDPKHIEANRLNYQKQHVFIYSRTLVNVRTCWFLSRLMLKPAVESTEMPIVDHWGYEQCCVFLL